MKVEIIESLWIIDHYYYTVKRVVLSEEKVDELDEMDDVEGFLEKYAEEIGYNKETCDYMITSNDLETIKL